MRKPHSTLQAVRSLSGIVASVIVFCLVVEVDDWPLEIHHCLYLFMAALSFAGAMIPLPPRPPIGAQKFSLSEHGLSPREKLFVFELLAGKTPKEIAADYGLAPSTVRNGMSQAVKKLGLSKSAELYALGAAYEIVD